jgi:CheY-like chemotaxis protein
MILLVDDNQDLALAFRMILQSRGYKTHAITSGKEALQYLQNAELPRLILVDYSMPEMNGEEFVSALKIQMPDVLEKTKIVGLSSFSPEAYQLKRFKEMITDFSEKPVDITSFIGLVRKHIT